MFIKYSYLILNNNNAFLIYFLKQLHRDDMNTKKGGGRFSERNFNHEAM